MTAKELIEVIQSANPDEITRIRELLRVPNADYARRELSQGETPRNMGDLWNRKEQALKPGS